jgi:hypothetical protein
MQFEFILSLSVNFWFAALAVRNCSSDWIALDFQLIYHFWLQGFGEIPNGGLCLADTLFSAL